MIIITLANINSIVVSQLFIPSLEISDLTGIEDFTYLSVLNCNYNNLTTLNLSNNQNLVSIKSRIIKAYFRSKEWK